MKRGITALAVIAVASTTPLLAQRFDNIVRADFFAGYRGDAARLARGMATCEEALTKDPKNAAALVWHGGGLLYQSGQKFRAGDFRAGLDLQRRGLKEMDDAVALKPDDLQTLIPRGAVLLASAPHFPDEAEAQPLLKKAVGDWEKVLGLQSASGARPAVHSRGELLGGLAVGYRLLGDRNTATLYLERIVKELAGSPYAERARMWLDHPDQVKRTDRFCIGCHE